MARSTRQVTISPSATVSRPQAAAISFSGQGLRDAPPLARLDHGAQGGGRTDRIHGIPR